MKNTTTSKTTDELDTIEISTKVFTNKGPFKNYLDHLAY